jgi:hypothetical protein
MAVIIPTNEREKVERLYGSDYIQGIHWHLKNWFVDAGYPMPLNYEHGGLLQYTIRERMMAADRYLTEVADAMHPFVGVKKPTEEYIKTIPDNIERGFEAAKHIYLILQSIKLQYEDIGVEEHTDINPKLPPFPKESHEDKDNGDLPPFPEAA